MKNKQFRQGRLLNMKLKATENGFTIIELMLAIAVAGILLVIAIPSFNGLLQGKQLVGQASEVSSALSYARSEAIARANDVIICSSTDGASCKDADVGNWSTGWIIFTGPADGNGDPASAANILKIEGDLYGEVSLNALDSNNVVVGAVTFNYQGESGADSLVTFNLCAENADEAQLDQNKSRLIQVNSVGAASIQMGTASC